ncbi:MAG: sigma-70 family RNA polymerase sigma factor [Bacteroidetes bacterium]|nr:sigma-70 family RNA polymerase sigma factor [Bacteroidota bacterium]MCH8524401.1 sigma-70 family RNA polymerase sigma factor [Balneolales bacterium]
MESSLQSNQSDVTRLLGGLRKGDENARQMLFDLVYDNLRIIARNQLRKEGPDHTLSRTDLVHEVFFKIMAVSETDWQDRGHFYAIAAKAMRQILTDHARKKLADKRGSNPDKVPIDERTMAVEKQASELIDLDEALTELAQFDERLAKIIELRFYAGLNLEETAKSLDVSSRTVNRDWIKARAWLHERLKNG